MCFRDFCSFYALPGGAARKGEKGEKDRHLVGEKKRGDRHSPVLLTTKKKRAWLQGRGKRRKGHRRFSPGETTQPGEKESPEDPTNAQNRDRAGGKGGGRRRGGARVLLLDPAATKGARFVTPRYSGGGKSKKKRE